MRFDPRYFIQSFVYDRKKEKKRDSSTNLTFYSKSNYPIDNSPSIEINFSIDSVSLVRALFISITRLVTRCVSKQCSKESVCTVHAEHKEGKFRRFDGEIGASLARERYKYRRPGVIDHEDTHGRRSLRLRSTGQPAI